MIREAWQFMSVRKRYWLLPAITLLMVLLFTAYLHSSPQPFQINDRY